MPKEIKALLGPKCVEKNGNELAEMLIPEKASRRAKECYKDTKIFRNENEEVSYKDKGKYPYSCPDAETIH